MTFVTKQNAGFLKSARSWGVLGLALALAVLSVSYGQEPRQVPPTPLAQLQGYVPSVAALGIEAAKMYPGFNFAVANGTLAVESSGSIVVVWSSGNALGTVALIGVVKIRGITDGFYLINVNPDGTAVLTDQKTMLRKGKATTTLPRGTNPIRQVTLLQPSGDENTLRFICIGKWDGEAKTCKGIYIEF